MYSVTAIAVFVWGIQVNAKELVANYIGDGQSSVLLNNLVHRLLDKLVFDRAFPVSRSEHVDLDNATLGKPGHLTNSARGQMPLGAMAASRGVTAQVPRLISPAQVGEMEARTGSAGHGRGWRSSIRAGPICRPKGGQRTIASRSAANSMKYGSFKATLPQNEGEMLSQVQTAVQAALSDGYCLQEVEMPLTTGVGVGTGDSIAISEYNAQQGLLRRFVELWEWLGTAESVRVFFPDAAETSIALNGADVDPVSGQWKQEATFQDWPGDVDYLMNDGLFSQTSRRSYGLAELPQDLTGKQRVEETMKVDDRLYVIGYPYDNTDELVKVMQLWEKHARPTIIFNGGIDNVRTGFFPFGNGKKLQKEFVPQIETVYYLHIFKGQIPGALVRAYPGPWRVLRALQDGGFECVQETEDRPTLRDVALKFFSGGLTSSGIAVDTMKREPLTDNNEKYYEVLGVDRKATRQEITTAYRQQAREKHPDTGGDPMIFYEISKAYAVLRNSENRALYDKYGERWVEVTMKQERERKEKVRR